MKFFTTNISKLSVVIFLLLLLASAALLQKKYDAIVHPQIVFTTETRYILPTFIVKNFSFGFKNILADLYWVRAIQDFSIWDGTDPFYLQEYKNITTLDPAFSYPYLLGILTFTSRSVNDKNGKMTTLETLEPTIALGMKSLPDNWEIPFYLGTGFQLTKNPEKALYYLKIAASHPDAPERIHNAYTTYLKNTLTGKSASGTDLVKAIYETTSSETTKKILKEGVMINDLTDIIKTVVASYKNKYGIYPSSLNDLINRKMIREDAGPELKNNYNIVINSNTGNVTITARKIQ